MKGIKEYPILGWHYCKFTREPEVKVDEWHELGLNIVTLPYELDEKEKVFRSLDRADSYGMKLILMDPRTHWREMTKLGEEAYRRQVKDAIADFGSHPATFGFYVGDEPDKNESPDAFKALRIQQELAPHLQAFLNLLPWFNWIGPRLGVDKYADYLDRACKESGATVLGYDCYAQMLPDRKEAYRDYFNNLREWLECSKRNGTPFVNTVLCNGHYNYRCPSKDDLLWQLSSSAAMGAAGVMWYHVENRHHYANYRNAPINIMGEKAIPEFYNMREVNCVFNEYVGKTLAGLTIDKCYHAVEAFGGMPLFEPFDNLVDVQSNQTPLIVSSFLNEGGERYYAICNNSPFSSTFVSLKFKGGVTMTRCNYHNTFEPIHTVSDPVGEREVLPDQSVSFFLSPGMLTLLKEETK